jgi:hypothetical protein
MPRNRAFRILLFPIIAITFLVGWVMYSVGGSKADSRKLPQQASPAKKQVDLEMGLLAEVQEEEQIAAKN